MHWRGWCLVSICISELTVPVQFCVRVLALLNVTVSFYLLQAVYYSNGKAACHWQLQLPAVSCEGSIVQYLCCALACVLGFHSSKSPMQQQLMISFTLYMMSWWWFIFPFFSGRIPASLWKLVSLKKWRIFKTSSGHWSSEGKEMYVSAIHACSTRIIIGTIHNIRSLNL